MPSIAKGSIRTAQNLAANKMSRELFSAIVKTQGVDEITLKNSGYSDNDLKPLFAEGLIALTPKGFYVPSARGLTFANDLNSLDM